MKKKIIYKFVINNKYTTVCRKNVNGTFSAIVTMNNQVAQNTKTYD